MAAGSLPRVATPAAYPRGVASVAAALGVALRWYAPTAPAPNADEMFTGVFAQVPVGELTDRLLARGDTHPPLDYLLRHPFVGSAAVGGDLFGLRLVSLVSATGVVVVVWWWMRDRGWFGALTVVFTACSPFLAFYGRMARPYSPLMLAGTVFVVAAERWSAGARRAWVGVAGVALLVALLLESSAALLLLGGALLAGRRRDRAAWEWRAGLVGAMLAWVVLWGWRVPAQYQNNGAEWIPLVRPDGAVILAGLLVTVFYPEIAVIAAVVLAVGVACVRRVDAGLGRLVVRVAVVPLVCGLLAAFVAHIGLERSFAALAWAPPLVLAAIVVVAGERSRVLAVVTGALLAILILPSLVTAYRLDDGIGVAAAVVHERARPGDLTAISPAALDHVLRWTFGGPLGALPAGVTRASVVAVDSSAGSAGRLWTIDIEGHDVGVEGRRPCAGFAHEELDVVVRCFEPAEPVTPPR
jgi:hypothetical protein